jgi:hypothetical protein
MRTYLPKMATLQLSQGIWCVEAAWTDQIAEAYYLGGDFDGRNDCFFYYMVWHDQDFDYFNVGYNLHGQSEVPFSKMRCVVIASCSSLRDALAWAEDHALKRLETSRGGAVPGGPDPLSIDPTLGIPAQPSGIEGYHPASLRAPQ